MTSHSSRIFITLFQRSFHDRFVNQNSENFFYTIFTKMEKAIAEIKSCHAVATTEVTGGGNTKPRMDDMQVWEL